MPTFTLNAINKAQEYADRGVICSDCGERIKDIPLTEVLNLVAANYAPDDRAGRPLTVHTNDVFYWLKGTGHKDFGNKVSCKPLEATLKVVSVAVVCPHCGYQHLATAAHLFTERRNRECGRCSRVILVPVFEAKAP